jgi:hypothetical protein
VWKFIKKLKIELPYDPALPSLGIYPKECSQTYSRDTCTPTFITALLTIAKLWHQSRYPTTREWIMKNEIMSFTGKRMELEIIMLNEKSQAQKDKYCLFVLICGI